MSTENYIALIFGLLALINIIAIPAIIYGYILHCRARETQRKFREFVFSAHSGEFYLSQQKKSLGIEE